MLTRLNLLTAEINQVIFDFPESLESTTVGKRASEMTPDFPLRLVLNFRKTVGDFAF